MMRHPEFQGAFPFFVSEPVEPGKQEKKEHGPRLTHRQWVRLRRKQLRFCFAEKLFRKAERKKYKRQKRAKRAVEKIRAATDPYFRTFEDQISDRRMVNNLRAWL